jgi:hypothetical protein
MADQPQVKTEIYSLNLDSELMDRVNLLAYKEGITVTELITNLLRWREAGVLTPNLRELGQRVERAKYALERLLARSLPPVGSGLPVDAILAEFDDALATYWWALLGDEKFRSSHVEAKYRDIRVEYGAMDERVRQRKSEISSGLQPAETGTNTYTRV